jgi:hypothetical protein
MKYIKLIIFSLLPTLLILATIEIGWRVVYFQLQSSATTGLGDLYERLTRSSGYRVQFDRPLFVKDAQLGYVSAPGTHDITLISSGGTRSFRAVIGADGYRVTTRQGSPDAVGKDVWIFGCSFTWGWGVNDDETYPWLIQERFRAFRVRNLGGNAYGNVHALVQLRDLLETGARPAVAVFAYNSFQLPRNIAAPEWLGSLHIVRTAFRDLTYLRAGLDQDGHLYTTLVPIINPGLDRVATGVISGDVYYELLVTKEIFRATKELADRDGVAVILAFQTPGSNDAVVAYARAIGYRVADLTVPRSNEYTLHPVDHHPNAAAHRLYATKLAPVLDDALRGRARSRLTGPNAAK